MRKFWKTVRYLLCAGLFAAMVWVLADSGVVSRVAYQWSGSEEVWQEAAAEEGLVSAVEEYYYDHLPEELHEAYREIYVHLMRGEDSGNFLSSITAENFWTAYYAVLADHPEIFWIDSSAQVEESGLTGKVVTFQFDVTVPSEERDSMRQQLEEAADACISQIPEDASDYEKIKYVYEYIINTTEYDSDSEDSQNMQSALLYHASVCAGYSKAFQYILHRMGLFCTYITGSIVNGGDHGWNMVRITEPGETEEAVAGLSGTPKTNYYYVDVTWGDPVFAGQQDTEESDTIISYNYLCCTQEELFRTHVPDDLIELPECTSDLYDYYKLNGEYYETFDYDVIYQALMTSVQNGDSYIQMKFGSADAYVSAQEALFGGDLLDDPGHYLMRQNGVTSWNYRYHTDDDFYLITLYWK